MIKIRDYLKFQAIILIISLAFLIGIIVGMII